MKVFLIGFMGAGKTSVGKKLAKLLHADFIDLDVLIEAKANNPVGEIFDGKGEAYFRKLENEALKEVVVKNNIVIATGGGTPCYHGNLTFMNNNGTTVYLRVDKPTILKRLERSKADRPLIRGFRGDDLNKYIDSKLAEREPYYLGAHLILQASHIENAVQHLYRYFDEKGLIQGKP